MGRWDFFYKSHRKQTVEKQAGDRAGSVSSCALLENVKHVGEVWRGISI